MHIHIKITPIMSQPNQEKVIHVDNVDLAHGVTLDDGTVIVDYLVGKLQEAMGNPLLQADVQSKLQGLQSFRRVQEERAPERPPHGETSTRGTFLGHEEQRDEESPRRQENATRRELSKERDGSDTPITSDSDVAPRRQRNKRSQSPPKRKRPSHTSNPRRKQRKRSPSSSPSSSSYDESSDDSSKRQRGRGSRRSYAAWKRSHKLKKFKEGGKNITFLTYDGTFGVTDKVLAFIQQFDAAFGDEHFLESSKLRNVSMHFQKSAVNGGQVFRALGQAPKTWKVMRIAIMKQFLSSDAQDKVLTEWQSLKMAPHESTQKYVDKFWELHLKATVYMQIDFVNKSNNFVPAYPRR